MWDLIKTETDSKDRDLFYLATYFHRAPYETTARVDVRGYIEAIEALPHFGRPHPLICAEFSATNPRRAQSAALKFAAELVLIEGAHVTTIDGPRVRVTCTSTKAVTALSLALGFPFHGRF